MNNDNIFLALYRWARANQQGENFTTDAFASLLREMINRDSQLASRFLGWLCFGSERCCFFGRETKVETQWTAEGGRPDIRITDRQAIAIVEVKTESNVGPCQLKHYRQIVNGESVPQKRLILLTVSFDASVGEDEKLLDHWRRWHEVEERLRESTSCDRVVQFLIEQFTSFLKGSGMAYDRVEWQYIDGVKSLVDLTQMLVEACNQAGVSLAANPRLAWGDGNPWLGLCTAGNKFWISALLKRPELVRFRFNNPNADDIKLNAVTNWKKADGVWERSLNLSSEDVYFFSRSKKHQVDVLANFIKEAHDVATECLVPGQASPQTLQEPPQAS